MKFRSSILSLAAVSALTATAFMVTGCGSSSSSGTSGTTPSTATNLTGNFAKGFWGGVPYTLQRHVDNSTTGEMTTEDAGKFSYSNLDNATFNLGLGLKATFQDLNLVTGSDVFAEDATTIKQGTTTVTANKEELMTKIGAIYQQMGVLENATDVDAARVNAISKQLDAVYTAAPTKYAVATGNQLTGFNAAIGDLYTALIPKLEAVNVVLTDKQKNVTDLKLGYTSNVSDVTTQRDKIISERASSATLTNAPAAGDLRYAVVYAARPSATNNSVMAAMSMGNTPTKGTGVNGTIIQNVTSATGAVNARMIFTTPDYKEGSEIRYQDAQASAGGAFENQTAGRYMFTLTPIMDNAVTPSPTTMDALSAFNITVGSDVYQFHNVSTASADSTVAGYYNTTAGKFGVYNVTKMDGVDFGILLMNESTGAVRVTPYNISTATATANATGGSNTTTNMTVGFKTDANTASRTFVGYYWDKVVDFANLVIDTTAINGATKADIKIDK